MTLVTRGRPDSLRGSGTSLWQQKILTLPLKEARKTVIDHAEKFGQLIWHAYVPDDKLVKNKKVGVFVPETRWNEVASFDFLYAMDCQILYPRLHGRDLQFHSCSEQDLVENPIFQIKEPPPGLEVVVPDVVFTPALMVDCEGQRIGRGLGFYDRFFSKHPNCQRIAVIHSQYIFPHFPAEWLHPGDEKVDALLTEKAFQIINERNLSL